MGRSKHPIELKLHILQLFEEGYFTIWELCERFSIHPQTLYSWKMKYEASGPDGLQEATSCKFYSKELKLAAVEDYIQRKYSLMEVLATYEISSTSVLKRWLKKYTSHSELKDSGKGMGQAMIEGRKTTFEERIEIVEYCLKHQKNYQLAAHTYGVSYQQVYQWTKKFETNGEEGLRDRRGRTKDEVELTVEEKLKLEIQRIERENERLRAENLFLKKLEEIERRRR